MKLLLFTFVLDQSHTALAWQVSVMRELASRVERLVVVTSAVGRLEDVPANTEVVVVPVRPLGIPQRLGGRFAFNRQLRILCVKHRIDAAFIHMAINWAYTSGPMLRLMGIPVIMWYAHGTVTRRLKWAVRCVDAVVTSTSEGCRVNDPRVQVIGQAIDSALFRVPKQRLQRSVLYVGRISPRKRVDLLYRVARTFEASHPGATWFDVVGGPLNQRDIRYDHGIRDLVWSERDEVLFRMHGHVPHARLPEFYQDAFVHLNLSDTGSMDKTVMEALSCGCPVLTSNPAFFSLFERYPEFVAKDDRPEAVAERIAHIYDYRAEYDPQVIRSLIAGHELYSYAERVLDQISLLGRDR